jgi:hypothetical protein
MSTVVFGNRLNTYEKEDSSFVKTDTADVFANPKKSSRVVLKLNRTEKVFVEFNMLIDDDLWCAISLKNNSKVIGYVKCDNLKIIEWSQPKYIEYSDVPADLTTQQ